MTHKITFDIESMHPWQKDLLTTVSQSKGEMKIMMAGRNIGKSVFTQQAIDRLMRDLNSQPVSDMVLGEGKIYGARYYTVGPVGGNWLDMETWCTKTFGEGSRALWGEKTAPEPSLRWYANNRKFWFRDIKDRDWFLIRWNS